MLNVSKKVRIADLPEELAIQIFGRPVYEAWKAWMVMAEEGPKYEIAGINPETNEITLKACE